jgi:hypothetical protein
MFGEFIKTVKILEELDEYSKMRIIDAARVLSYKRNAKIIAEVM